MREMLSSKYLYGQMLYIINVEMKKHQKVCSAKMILFDAYQRFDEIEFFTEEIVSKLIASHGLKDVLKK